MQHPIDNYNGPTLYPTVYAAQFNYVDTQLCELYFAMLQFNSICNCMNNLVNTLYAGYICMPMCNIGVGLSSLCTVKYRVLYTIHRSRAII